VRCHRCVRESACERRAFEARARVRNATTRARACENGVISEVTTQWNKAADPSAFSLSLARPLARVPAGRFFSFFSFFLSFPSLSSSPLFFIPPFLADISKRIATPPGRCTMRIWFSLSRADRPRHSIKRKREESSAEEEARRRARTRRVIRRVPRLR
jgi:hypothetical protein